ncbi:hypothetical protein SLEP1_g30129 [Rubroshorea leprosula]|uniref:Phosphoglycerate mutase n=1 Tax=Rubroshorea leprosula TaxID=152421 RepID=A0AAV5K554_9ROSI|nr:hypothetical protein SLEP1_g30129 [Rubroshorea leprosula]
MHQTQGRLEFNSCFENCCRGLRPCDMRRRVSEYQSLFPSLDYSMANGWLWTRPEKEIAVVSHGIVLQHMLYVLGNDCENTALFKRFDNCELRSVVIVDKSMMASDWPKTSSNRGR